jgi:uncharacterized protein (TIGR02217 family)
MAFHEVQFPTGISKGSSGGPRRMTDVVTLRSGFEQRNSIWANSRRSYNAGLGLQDLGDLYAAVEFFEARRGRLHGFRWKDWADYKSKDPISATTDTDVQIGVGDNSVDTFQLVKVYSASSNPYTRTISKPVNGTVKIALDGSPQTETTHYSVNYTTGIVTFVTPPGSSVVVTAGFEFDVPVRFDIDQIIVNVEQFNAGAVPDIDVVEVRL